MPRFLFVLLGCLIASTVFACTYCDPNSLKLSTLRQESRSAKLVAIVTPTNPRLVGEQGMTDLVIDKVFKNDSTVAIPKSLVLNRWMPVDPKKPQRLLVFVDVTPQFDPYRGIPLKGTAISDYLTNALKLDDRDRISCLKYYFQFLDHAEAEVAADAFLEFAKASDSEIAAVCRHLDPVKIRQLVLDPKTPTDRLGLYGYLLGATGNTKDVDTLTTMIRRLDPNSSSALSGLLGGLISLDSKLGWSTVNKIITDDQTAYQHKLAALGTLRFFQASQAKTHRTPILEGMKAIVLRGDMADMAIEDLRRWSWWDLSEVVISQYGKKSHAAPLVKNSILRYAISCQDRLSQELIRNVRQTDSELVDEIESSMNTEKKPSPTPKAP